MSTANSSADKLKLVRKSQLHRMDIPNTTSVTEITSILTHVETHKIKLLCLIPLDQVLFSHVRLKSFQQSQIDVINSLTQHRKGGGDTRIIAYAGVWDTVHSDPNTSIGYIATQYQQSTRGCMPTDIIFPVAATDAVNTIFSLWFDRGHRNKNILISGSKMSGEEINKYIDISILKPISKPQYWDKERDVVFSETVEIPTNRDTFITYLKSCVVINSPAQTIATPIPPPIQRVEIEPPSPEIEIKTPKPEPPPIPKTVSIPSTNQEKNAKVVVQPSPSKETTHKRGEYAKSRKWWIITPIVVVFVLILINAPTINLFGQSYIAQKTTLQSKEDAILSRYRQLVKATEIVSQTTNTIPGLNFLAAPVINQANQAQNYLLELKVKLLLAQTIKHMMSAAPGDPYQTLSEAKYALEELYVRESIQTGNHQKLEQINQARQFIELLPQLIPPDKKITLLLLLQNNLELRPSGGFIGAASMLTFDHGKLLTTETRDIYDLDSNLKGIVNPPADLKTHLGESSWYFRDANWSPNFIESAASANWFLEKEWGSAADSIIGLNLNTLKTILAATGPITLPNGTVVESDNLLATAFNHQDVPIAKPDSSKQEFLSQLVKPLIDFFSGTNPETASNMLSAFGKAANQGELTIVSNQPAILSELTDAKWSGSLQPPPCRSTYPEPCVTDNLAVNEANVGINKSNFYITRTIDHSITLSSQDAKHTHTITYTNNSPTDTWPGGTYKVYIRPILSPGASSIVVTSNNQPVPVTTSGAIPGYFIEVKPKTSIPVTISYITPLKPSYASYQFHLDRQPGVSNDPLIVSVTPPTGYTLKPLPNNPFPEASLRFNGTFQEDFTAAFSLTQ